MAEIRSKVLIIGSGPAGYTAAIYAARSGLEPVLVSGAEIGGQLVLSEEVDNYPGFVGSGRGIELMTTIKSQVEALNVKIIEDRIVEVDFKRRPFICSSENHNLFYADAVVIATGASAKWLDVPGEKELRGFGVSVCATCDGFFYRNKDVAVVGGGNSAAEEALYLTNFARSVMLIHRRDTLRADQILQQKLLYNQRIRILYDTTVEYVEGSGKPLSLSNVKIKNVKSDKIEDLKIDGLFVAIGHKPNTEIFRNQLELDSAGYIKTAPDSCATSVEGVFAAGDVQDSRYRQAIIAAGSGAMAAMEVQRYLSH